jgi:outer membrane protein TolC
MFRLPTPIALILAFTVALPSLSIRAETLVGRKIEKAVSGDLSLDRSLELAMQQNPEILKALQEIERTRGQIIEVRAQALPRIGATATFNQTDQNLLQIGGQGTQNNNIGADDNSANSDLINSLNALSRNRTPVVINDKSWRVALEARQIIYSGGKVSAAIQIAKLTADSSYWSLRDTIDRIMAKIRTQFVNVLRTRALIQVQEESIQLLTNQLKDQQNRFDAGTVPRFNVLRAEVALSNARPELIRARNNHLIAQLELARSLNLEPGQDGHPSFHCVGSLDVPERTANVLEALQVAKEKRPFLKVQRQTILLEAEQVKVAISGILPQIEASGGYEFRNSRLTKDLESSIDGWFLGVNGRWDIFDGLATYGRTKQAQARLKTAKVNYDDSVLQVELEVQQAHALLRQARETIQSQQKAVEQALESLRLANERLAAGAGTQLDVLDARVALTQARTTELQARADYNAAIAEFDRVTATTTIYEELFNDPLAKKMAPKKPIRTAPTPAPQTKNDKDVKIP